MNSLEPMAQDDTLAIIRPDLKEEGLAVPIGEKLYFRGSRPLACRWVFEGTDKEQFQVLFYGHWQDAYSIDFDFIYRGPNGGN